MRHGLKSCWLIFISIHHCNEYYAYTATVHHERCNLGARVSYVLPSTFLYLGYHNVTAEMLMPCSGSTRILRCCLNDSRNLRFVPDGQQQLRDQSNCRGIEIILSKRRCSSGQLYDIWTRILPARILPTSFIIRSIIACMEVSIGVYQFETIETLMWNPIID